MMTTATVQFALQLDEDRPSKHIAARGCGPLAQPNAPATQKRRFLPPSYTEARFGDPTTPEEVRLYAELNRLDGMRAKVKGAEKRRLAETFREVNAKAEKLFKGRRFWGAADRSLNMLPPNSAPAVRPRPIPPESWPCSRCRRSADETALPSSSKGVRRRTAERFGSGPLTSAIRLRPSISLVMAFMSAVTWFIRTSMRQVQRRTQTRE